MSPERDEADEWAELFVSDLDGESAEAVHQVFERFLPLHTVLEEWRPPDPERGRAQARNDRFVVRGYLRSDERAVDTRRRLEEAVWFLGRIRPLPPLRVRDVPSTDWSTRWRRAHVGQAVGEKLWIATGPDQPTPAGRIGLRLEPGTAFGLGSHPTTRLALELLERAVRPGQRVADVGSGSGVLALAALQLGAAHVDACDLDPAAVAATREAGERHGFRDRLRVSLGSLETLSGPYDLIVVNVVASTLLTLLPRIPPALVADGQLVVSGLLAADRARVLAALPADAGSPVDERSAGDWCGIRWAKRLAPGAEPHH